MDEMQQAKMKRLRSEIERHFAEVNRIARHAREDSKQTLSLRFFSMIRVLEVIKAMNDEFRRLDSELEERNSRFDELYGDRFEVD